MIPKLTKEDENNLNAVFGYARQATVNNEKELIGIINFKAALWEKLFPKEPFTETVKKGLAKKATEKKK